MTLERNQRGRSSYISASQINSYIDRRDQFIRNYILGFPWLGNASFSRGNAIEWAVDQVVQGREIDEVCNLVYQEYLDDCEKNNLTEKQISKFDEDHIVAMARCSCHFYKYDLGAVRAASSQVEILVNLPGISLPVKGFADFVFPEVEGGPFGEEDKGIRDFKTAAKSPSKDGKGRYALSAGYARQGTVYKMATGRPVTFDYCVATKEPKMISVPLYDDVYHRTVPIIKEAARRMDALWSAVPEPEKFTETHKIIFEALGFPQIGSIWDEEEKRILMEEFIPKLAE